MAEVPFELVGGEAYDSWFERHLVEAELEARAVEALVDCRSSRCVDVGGGSGWFAARLGAELVVDASESMLRTARRRGLDVLLADAASLPLRSRSFDYALLVAILCFAPEPRLVLAESARVAGRGVVACIIPSESPWSRWYSSRAGHPVYRWARFMTLEWLAREASSLGLRVAGWSAAIAGEPGRWEPAVVHAPAPPGEPWISRYAFHCLLLVH